MKRPLFIGCLSYVLTLAVAVTIPSTYLKTAAAIVATAVFLLFLLSLWKKSAVKALYITVVSLLSLVSVILYNYTTVDYAIQLPGKTVNLTATVIENGQSSSGNTYVIAKLNTVNENEAARGVKVKIYTTNHEVFDDYDEISTTVSFYDSNYSSASENYFISNSIFASGATTKSVKIINKDKFSLFREICEFRDELMFRIRYSIPNNEGEIVCGILFGERDYIDAKTIDKFSASGISHLLAVSGMHLTIIISLLELLLRVFRINKCVRSILALVLCFFMAVITGFTPSILRASIMVLFLLTAQLIRYDYDNTTALGVSAVVICIINPYAILNVGFQLSFCATFGIIVSQKIIESNRRRFSLKTVGFIRLFVHELLNLILPCVFAFLFTIPITACVFGTLSTYSPILNFLISPLVPILMVFIILSCIAVFLPTSIISSIIFLITRLIVSCIRLAESFSSLPYSMIKIDNDLLVPIMLIVVLMLIIGILSKRPVRNTICAVMLSICIICCAFVSHSYTYRNTVSLNIINSSIILQTDDKIIITGYTKNSSYEISNIISRSGNKKLCYLSAENVINKDISSLTHFLISYPIETVAVPKNHALALGTVDQINSKLYNVENICAKYDDVKITTKIYGKNSVTFLEIGDFTIASLNVKSKDNIPQNFKCDLLVANSKAIPFIEKYNAKYFVFAEEANNPKYLSNLLAKHKIKYLGDVDYGEVLIKENSVYIRRDFLKLAL